MCEREADADADADTDTDTDTDTGSDTDAKTDTDTDTDRQTDRQTDSMRSKGSNALLTLLQALLGLLRVYYCAIPSITRVCGAMLVHKSMRSNASTCGMRTSTSITRRTACGVIC